MGRRKRSKRSTQDNAQRSKPVVRQEPSSHTFKRTVGILALFAVAVVGGWAAWPRNEAAPKHTDILLISIDTLRADHLGCYGYALAQTPNIDRMANEGVLFEQASSPVPLTLPSHSAMFTGLIPPRTGVRLNSGHKLPSAVQTLAETLKEHGYRTAAFIGALPLERAGGLDQGFDLYDDKLPVAGEPGSPVPRRERYAETVLNLALKWLRNSDPAQPVFAFVHLFDPHQPHEQTMPGESKPTYDGEIAYVDRALGPFLKALQRDSRWNGLLTVLTSDHGESLYDHGEKTHGLFVYQSTLHVPLIVHHPRKLSPRRVPSPVSIVDLPPTILELASLPKMSDIDGRSLVALTKQSDPPLEPIYFESLVSSLRCGWAPLRGIRLGNLKYISAPTPELYDLQADPNEKVNLHDSRPDDAARLAQYLFPIGDGTLATVDVDEGRLQDLESLGYITSSLAGPDDESAGIDPKDRIDVFEKYQEAHRDYLNGKFREALSAMESVESYFPNSPKFHLRFGDHISRLGDWPRAKKHYKKSAQLDPKNQVSMLNYGVALYKCNDLQESLTQFEALLRLNPDHIKGRRCAGQLCQRLNRPAEEAIAHFTRFLELAPEHPAARTVRQTVADLSRR